jgi:hypothetical protein
MNVGVFAVLELEPGRWRMTNGLTRISHVTYGSVREVKERARRQTDAWRRKIAASKGVGAAWRRSRV